MGSSASGGDHDLVVPLLGTEAWVRSLGFSVVDDWRAWHLDGQSAGYVHDKLIKQHDICDCQGKMSMHARAIHGAGHTAPEYEPERCFAMFSRWILNRPL
nr:unnamed protein product [Digitaria exilis]